MQQTQPVKTWMNILTHPGIETFNIELDNVQGNSKSTWNWLFISIVIFAALRGVSVVIAQVFGNFYRGPSELLIISITQKLELEYSVAEIITMIRSPFFWFSLVFFSLTLLTSIIILTCYGTGFGIAKIFGGKGSFSNHAYSLTIFVAPILILAGLFGLLGFLGNLLFFLLWIYVFVLTFYATKTVHLLSNIRAFISTLIPFLLMSISSVIASLII